mmetsp:Transcript_10092/g.15299  ORF Transcript_10092/g.15299 Transcript_10092/m.15299 type:complete len:1212 (-) Transcript_10092:360-3995(-)
MDFHERLKELGETTKGALTSGFETATRFVVDPLSLDAVEPSRATEEGEESALHTAIEELLAEKMTLTAREAHSRLSKDFPDASLTQVRRAVIAVRKAMADPSLGGKGERDEATNPVITTQGVSTHDSLDALAGELVRGAVESARIELAACSTEAELQAALKDSTDRIQSLEIELALLREAAEDRSMAEAIITDLRAQVTALKEATPDDSEYKLAQAAQRIAEDQLDIANARIIELEAQLHTPVKDDKSEAIKVLEEKCASLEARLQSSKEALAHSEDKASLEERCATLESALSAKTQAADASTKRIEALEEALAQAKKENEEALAQIKNEVQISAREQDLEQQLAQAQKKMTAYAEVVNKAKEKIEATKKKAKDSNAKVREESAQATKRAEAAEGELAVLRTTLAQKESEYAEALEKYESQKTALEEELSSSKSPDERVAELEQELAWAREDQGEELNMLRREAETAKREARSAIAIREQLEKQIVEIEERAKRELENETRLVDELREESRKRLQALDEFKAETEKARKDLLEQKSKLEATLKQESIRADDAAAELAELLAQREDNNESEQNTNKAEEQLASTKSKLDAVVAKYNELKKSTKATLENKIKELKEKHAEDTKQLEAKLAAKSTELEKVQNDSRQQNEKFKASENQDDEAAANAKKKLEGVVKKYNELKQRSKDTITDLKAKLAASETELKGQREALESENANLKQQLAKIESAPPPAQQAEKSGGDDDGWGDDGWGEELQQQQQQRNKPQGVEEAKDPELSKVLAEKDVEIANLSRKLEAVVERFREHKANGKAAVEQLTLRIEEEKQRAQELEERLASSGGGDGGGSHQQEGRRSARNSIDDDEPTGNAAPERSDKEQQLRKQVSELRREISKLKRELRAAEKKATEAASQEDKQIEYEKEKTFLQEQYKAQIKELESRLAKAEATAKSAASQAAEKSKSIISKLESKLDRIKQAMNASTVAFAALLVAEDIANARVAAADAMREDIDRRAADGSLLAALREDANKARLLAAEERAAAEVRLEATRKEHEEKLERYKARSAAALRRAGEQSIEKGERAAELEAELAEARNDARDAAAERDAAQITAAEALERERQAIAKLEQEQQRVIAFQAEAAQADQFIAEANAQAEGAVAAAFAARDAALADAREARAHARALEQQLREIRLGLEKGEYVVVEPTTATADDRDRHSSSSDTVLLDAEE